MADASGREIWQHASLVSAVIVTKDQDFPGRRAIEQDGPQIVWLRCGNTRRRELLDWFEVRFVVILAALERGEDLVEIA